MGIRTGKPLSRATINVVDAKSLDQAHLYVLRNTAVVESYIDQAKQVFYVQDQQDENLSVVGFTPHKMYKYGESGETDDMLEFYPIVDVSQDSALVVFGDMEQNSASDHDEDSKLQNSASKSQRGPAIKPKANKGKAIVTYNKRGVPIGDEAKQLATFEGMAARTMVLITYDSWIKMQETGKIEEEIDRATLWKKARELKTGSFDSDVQVIVDKIDELHNSGCFESCGTHDVLTEALGTEEQCGHVRGMGENIEVMMEICVQSEASLPISLEDEFIFKVKDAVVHILSWPRHLVIRCSDLEKAMAIPMRKERLRELDEENEKENGNEKNQPREPKKENGKENAKKDDEIIENKKREKENENVKENAKMDSEIMENRKVKGKENENEKEMQRRMTRARIKTRIRIEKSVILKMTAMMVDGQVSKVDSIKVQCEDDLFGYESYTYLTWDDF
ncbi:hypothetical protein L1987_78159 [Smallanthus sonchifolius]|uniref:Uncharacterized protein n=1 Tax=Smallanthus sonchifolius TaxID=185202 RepID=A0ACB8ZGC9_9ASTR|nr:hypothetical protein L1987_78159 [Smallanthus sonchifolius]